MVASIRIANAAQLVASVPGLVGFIPTESLVMVVLRGNRMVFTIRHNVDAITTGDEAARLAEIIDANGGERVLLIGVSATPSEKAQAAMVRQLARHGIPVTRQLHVATCETATDYVDYATGETGTTIDYRDSAYTTARAVVTDRAVLASRGDLAQLFTTTTEADAVDPSTIDPEWTAQEMAGAVSLNTDTGPDLAARFGALIANVKIRDAMLRLGNDNAGTAATVMARTAAHLRGDARARVLTLAVFFFYKAGNGAAAGIAIDTATREGLTHTSLMTLLDRSLKVGMTPDNLHELVPTHEAATAALGAPFPI